MHATQHPLNRAQLRKSIRQKRCSLNEFEQQQHAQNLTKNICNLSAFRNARRIAFYLPEDGEIDTAYLIEHAWRDNKQVYLPVLAPFNGALYFAPYYPASKLIPNRFGINEPTCHPRLWLRARQLNLILLPLVAFDTQGNRLGMGGGFYDRSLAFTRYHKQRHSPQLIGLAHDLQKIEQLPCESWDIPLNMIATEKTIYQF